MGKTLRQEQRDATRFIFERDQALLFADIGTGKTAIALTVLDLWRKKGIASRAIVFAPSRVCNDVWPQEAEEWGHVSARVGSIAGKSAKVRRGAFEDGTRDVVCVNYENIPWLIREYPEGVPGFDCLWFDEIDKMKSHTSLRFKGKGRKGTRSWVQGMQHWKDHFPIRVGMTGTPVSNGLLDLWAQVFCIDSGERLSKAYFAYRMMNFYQSDWSGFKWKVRPGAEGSIYDSISDIAFRIEATDGLPEKVYTPPRYVDMPSSVSTKYKKMERDYVFKHSPENTDEQDRSVVAKSAAEAYSKLRQVVSGFVYQDDNGTRITHALHSEKYKELDDLISELNGKQLIVVFQFKHQADELRKRYKGRIACLDSRSSATEGSEAIRAWNAGELPLLGVQPASAGHGLNLQHSGACHICMLTEPESAGLFDQVVGRLARRGQSSAQVFVHTIHARGTIDEDRARVVASKRDALYATLDAIKERQK